MTAAFDTAAIHIVLPSIGRKRPLRSELIPEPSEVQAYVTDARGAAKGLDRLGKSEFGLTLPISDVRFDGEFRRDTGHVVLVLNLTGFDPLQT